MWQRIIRRILAGLLAMLPLVATYWVVSILFKFLGDLASPFLEQLGIKIPGLGIILTLLVIFLIGLLVIIFSELTLRFVNTSFYNNLMIILIPVILSLFLYYYFLLKFKITKAL